MKTYELPASEKNKNGEPSGVGKGAKTVGGWTGLGKKPDDTKAGPSYSDANKSAPVRQALKRMGTWGFKGEGDGSKEKNTGDKKADDEEEEDDRQIRFTIGGKGRRLTKEDFLKEIRSLDPKARAAIIADSDASGAMKTMAKKDASRDIPGSNRLYGAGDKQMASGTGIASKIGTQMAKSRGADIQEVEDSDDSIELVGRESPKRDARPSSSRGLSRIESSTEVPESEAERKRREQALKGVDDVTPAQRGRTQSRDSEEVLEETPAERRRRMAALGTARAEEDSDDDDTPRVPPPVAKSRGIRFAQSPVRGRR